MSNPTISVVIPTFNRPKYLERAINSVIKQTYQAKEIIVIVDGFSEATMNMVEKIKAKKKYSIKLIQTNEKVGGSEARNIGIRTAKGDLIALLDDDDEWLSDKLESQIKEIKQKNLDINDSFLCFTSVYRYINYEKGTYKILPNINYSDSSSKTIADYLFVPKGLRNQGFIQTSTIIVPRVMAQKTLFTKDMPKHQDWDWVLKLDENHELKILQVEEPKVIYHSDVPVNSRTGHINRWKYSEEWLNTHKEYLSKMGYENFILNYIFYLGISADNSLNKSDRIKELRKRISNISFKTITQPHFWKIFYYCFKNLVNI